MLKIPHLKFNELETARIEAKCFNYRYSKLNIMENLRKFPTIGCCGIDCGLCPRFNTQCPGCGGPDFKSKHPSCGILTCCIKKGIETCGLCSEMDSCQKISSWDKADSFVTHLPSLNNLRLIREKSMQNFIDSQQIRVDLLKCLLDNFNDGRSKNFYCLATALLPISEIQQIIEKLRQLLTNSRDLPNDNKERVNLIKKIIQNRSNDLKINLKLRK